VRNLITSGLPVCAAILFAGLAPVASGAAGTPAYAKNFEIADHGTYRVLTVRNAYRGASGEHRYALVPKNAPLPDLPEDALVVRTPVERVVTMETVHVGFLAALDRTDAIVGAATASSISQPKVRARLKKGEIRRIGSGHGLDVEALLLLQPDLILTTVLGDPAFDLPPKLSRAGLPVVLTAGYMEAHPVARAEWIKFVAAFFEAGEEADAFFAGVAARYETLREKAASAATRPTVFCGAPYSGAWYVPGGESFTAQSIRDAGGDYLWSDDGSRGGIPLDTERVFLKAARADIWLHPGRYRSLGELLGADPRFGQFRAARDGAVYNRTRPAAEGGGPGAVWERGVVRPDEVLADLIATLHPELLPEHAAVYYERLR
jgi:iron complex transport system substrate-binding protein